MNNAILGVKILRIAGSSSADTPIARERKKFIEPEIRMQL
jgi:hypothetical protein